MIQSNELKVGNLVLLKCYGEKDEVAKLLSVDEVDGCSYNNASNKKQINRKYNKIKNGWCRFDIIHPIELTEEILLKSGFEKRQESDNFFYFGYGLNPNTKDWMLYLNYFKNENTFFFLNTYHKINYVHELQNLYFSLTKQELIVTL